MSKHHFVRTPWKQTRVFFDIVLCYATFNADRTSLSSMMGLNGISSTFRNTFDSEPT